MKKMNYLMSMKKLRIFTDGAIYNHGEVGGWAAVILRDDDPVTRAIAGRELATTSNRMELQAVIEALEEASEIAPLAELEIELTSDSQYVVYGASRWLANWKKNNWKGAGGKVQNRDQWEKLDKFIQAGHITWHWVRGHNGNHYNEICDKLAVAQYNELQALDKVKS